MDLERAKDCILRSSSHGPLVRAASEVDKSLADKLVEVLVAEPYDFSEVVAMLCEALSGQSVSGRLAAAYALSHVANPDIPRRVGLSAEALSALPAMAKAVSGTNEEVRIAVIEALAGFAKHAGPEVVTAITVHSAVSLASAEANLVILTLRLCRVNAARHSVEWLLEALKHKSAEVRGAACDALGWMKIDASDAVQRLAAVTVYDPERRVRERAMRAITAIDPTGKFLLGSDAPLECKEAVLAVLCALPRPGTRVQRRLEKALSDVRNLKSGVAAQEPLESKSLAANVAEHSAATSNDSTTGPQRSKARMELNADRSHPPALRDGSAGRPSQETPTDAQSSDAGQQAVMKPAEFQRLLKTKKKIDPKGSYIGESLAILEVFQEIDQLNKRPADPVLILGESGSGKTEIASLIHSSSNRKEKPFCERHSTDMEGGDERIVRAEWAGHGPDSGLPGLAGKSDPGLLRECEGGTVFVDELAKVPGWFQTFLQRVLDQRTIPPAHGKGKEFKPNVRVIAATSEDLEEWAKDGKFQRDLLRRLRDRQIRIPPLRERRADIFFFVEQKCPGYKPEPDFLLCLLEFDWPGNIGQLIKVLNNAVDSAGGPKTPPDLKNGKGKRRRPPKLDVSHLTLSDESIIEQVKQKSRKDCEREVYEKLRSILERQGFKNGKGLQKRMASILGVNPATVSRRLDEFSADLPIS